VQGATIRRGTYYRCTARTLAPGAAAFIDHPATVNLREDVVLQPLNAWIGFLLANENVDQTVAALAASQGGIGGIADVAERIKAAHQGSRDSNSCALTAVTLCSADTTEEVDGATA
jgi:hypothetical protein